MKHSVRVVIAGEEYALRSTLSPEDAQQVAEFVNARIAEVEAGSRGVGTLQLVVLAFLKVAAAYLGKEDLALSSLARVRQRIELLAAEAERRLDGGAELLPGPDAAACPGKD